MLHIRSLTAVLAAVAISAGAQAADECQQAAYVEQCLLLSSDQAAACSTRPCATLVAEIKQRCESIRKSLAPATAAEDGGEPAFCKAHLGN